MWVHVHDPDHDRTLVFDTNHVGFVVFGANLDSAQINFKCGNVVMIQRAMWDNIAHMFDGHEAGEKWHGRH